MPIVYVTLIAVKWYGPRFMQMVFAVIQFMLVTLVPAACFHYYINRNGDAWTEGMTVAVFVFLIQSIMYLIGGTVCYSITALIFAFGLFLGYRIWHMKRVEATMPMPIGQHIVFAYRDWKFRFSRRRVKVTSFDNQCITGFCEMRQAERTFRRDRIQNGVIVEATGEVIDPCAPAYPDLHKK